MFYEVIILEMHSETPIWKKQGLGIFFIIILEVTLAFYGVCKRIGCELLFTWVLCASKVIFFVCLHVFEIHSYKMEIQKTLRPVSQNDIGSACTVRWLLL